MNFNELADDPEDTNHSPVERAAAASRSTWVSVGVNLVLTIAQITAGILAKSQGLVADGIHSLSDLVADFVVLFASHHSKKDAGDDFLASVSGTYGLTGSVDTIVVVRRKRLEAFGTLSATGGLKLRVSLHIDAPADRAFTATETRIDGDDPVVLNADGVPVAGVLEVSLPPQELNQLLICR